MKKYLFIFLCLLISGCGHTVYTSSKGIGLEIAWTPDTVMPSFRGGEYCSQVFVPRGNSNMSSTSSTGGVLGTGGTSQTITVATGMQLNEGNISKIFNNPLVDQKTKQIFATQLPNMLHKPTLPMEISTRTTYAAGATGPRAVLIKPESTGTDKIIDKVADNADVIKDVANTTVKVVGDTTKTSVIATILATKWLLIVIVIAAVIVIILLALLIKYLINNFHKRKITATSVAGKITIDADNIPTNQFLSVKNQEK